MNKIIKKICTIGLYTVLLTGTGMQLTSCNSNSSSNISEKYSVGLTFYLQDDGTYGVSAGDAKLNSNITIPSTYNGKTVTTIITEGFKECPNLKSIKIPNSITNIGPKAFEDCSSLTKITLGNSLASIGSSAFSGCNNLTSIYYTGTIIDWLKIEGDLPNTKSSFENFYILDENGDITYNGNTYSLLEIVIIPEGTIEIRYTAFFNFKHLISIEIPNSVTTIGERAFYNCSGLTSVTIGNGVNTIENLAFFGCYHLVEVINKSSLTITKGSSSNGYIGYYALNIKTDGSNEIVKKDNYLFYTYDNVNYLIEYVGTDASLVLPSDYDGASYVINNYAFYSDSNLTKIVIPNNVTSIGSWAFRNCSSLISIIIHDNVTSIGSYAFQNCTGLKTITLGCSVNIIEQNAFDNCRWIENIYYKGTPSAWNDININSSGNSLLICSTKHYYSETQPTDTTYKYWHYVDGEPTPWEI